MLAPRSRVPSPVQQTMSAEYAARELWDASAMFAEVFLVLAAVHLHRALLEGLGGFCGRPLASAAVAALVSAALAAACAACDAAGNLVGCTDAPPRHPPSPNPHCPCMLCRLSRLLPSTLPRLRLLTGAEFGSCVQLLQHAVPRMVGRGPRWSSHHIATSVNAFAEVTDTVTQDLGDWVHRYVTWHSSAGTPQRVFVGVNPRPTASIPRRDRHCPLTVGFVQLHNHHFLCGVVLYDPRLPVTVLVADSLAGKRVLRACSPLRTTDLAQGTALGSLLPNVVGWLTRVAEAWNVDADADVPATAAGSQLLSQLQVQLQACLLGQQDNTSCGRACMHNLLCLLAPSAVFRWTALREHPNADHGTRTQFSMLSLLAVKLVSLDGFSDLPFLSRLLAGDEAAGQLLADFGEDSVPHLSSQVLGDRPTRAVISTSASANTRSRHPNTRNAKPKPKPKAKPAPKLSPKAAARSDAPRARNPQQQLVQTRRVQLELRTQPTTVAPGQTRMNCVDTVWTRMDAQHSFWFVALRARTTTGAVFDVTLPALYVLTEVVVKVEFFLH